MARRLRAQGERVDFLLTMDTRVWNVRFRWLHLLTRWLGTALRLSPEDQQQLFFELRLIADAVERNLKACRKHLPDVLRKVYRRLRAYQPTHRNYSSLDRAYGRAVLSYVPPRYGYPGRVAVFLSEIATQERYDRDWHRMAEEVDVHLIPGIHSDSVTRHVRVVAEHLRACLDAAQGRDVPGAKP